MQAFVEWTSQHRLQLFPKLLAVRGFQMRVECRLIFPDFDDAEVVLSRQILQQLEADRAFVFAAVDGERMQDLNAIRGVVGCDIHVCNDVDLGVLAEGCNGREKEQDE